MWIAIIRSCRWSVDYIDSGFLSKPGKSPGSRGRSAYLRFDSDANSNGIRGSHGPRAGRFLLPPSRLPPLAYLNARRFMILHYRSTNYNPQIAAGVYNAAALSAHTRIREPRRASLVVKANTMHSPSHAMWCALFKHVSAETIVYNVSEESNLLARRSRTLCSVYPIQRKTRKNEREREREGQGW